MKRTAAAAAAGTAPTGQGQQQNTLKKVLISDEVDEGCISMLQESGIQVVKNTKLSKEQLIEEIKNFDGLVVRSATKVTRDVIEAGERLKIIGRAGTGVDNVDVEAATQRGIIVMNTPDGNTLSAAELTCTMLLAISRNIAQGNEAVKGENWKLKSSLMGNEMYGKTLAIIGLGRIGREVALRMQAFGMKTIGYDPLVSAEESAKYNVQWLSLEEIWPRADYITLHVPLIPQTKYLINAETLSKCRKGVRIVNCARGGIIEESALLAALKSGHCAAAGLDVFEQEPTTNLELVQHSRVTSTPHLGASTTEAQVRVARDIAKQFVEFSQGTALNGVVNAMALAHSLDSKKRPWIELTTALAQLSASLQTATDLNNVHIIITLNGSGLSDLKSGVGAAAAVGLFRNAGTTVNLVSAPLAIKQHNVKIDVEVSVGDVTSHVEQIYVEMKLSGAAAGRGVRVGGTVLCDQPYLLTVDQSVFYQPLRLAGNALFVKAGRPNALAEFRDKVIRGGTPVLSYVSTVDGSGQEGLWCCFQIFAPLAKDSLSSLVSNDTLVQQVHFQ